MSVTNVASGITTKHIANIERTCHNRAGTVALRFERIMGTRAYRTSELPNPPIPSEQLDRLLRSLPTSGR